MKKKKKKRSSFFHQIFNFMPFISSDEEKAQRPYVFEKIRVSCCIPLPGEQKYQVTNVGVKSKLDTFAGRRILNLTHLLQDPG